MNLCRLLLANCIVLWNLPAVASEMIVARGGQSTWQYLDTAAAPGKDWALPAFNAASWKSGPAPLGYGNKDMVTKLSFGPDSKSKPITAWFRRVVEVADPAKIENLVIRLRRDDGAVVYWNGKELFRSNMPAGEITSTTRAVDMLNPEMEKGTYHVSVASVKGQVVKGSNILGVEVHQCDPGSSDLIFDLEAVAYAPGEPLHHMDYFAEGFAALKDKDKDRAYKVVLNLDPAKQGYAEFMAGAWKSFAARGAPFDDRYFTLLDKARAAAPAEIELASAWVRAHVDARKGLPVKPAARSLPAAIPAEFRFIADTPPEAKPAPKSEPVRSDSKKDDSKKSDLVSRKKLLADIDDLELLLENCYAGLERRSANYRGALDALRASITADLPVSVFRHRLWRALTVFGDPQIWVKDRPMPQRIPALFMMYGEQVAAVTPDHTQFVVPDFPYLTEIKGRPVGDWIAAAERIVPRASAVSHRLWALRQLSDLAAVGRELSMPAPWPAVFVSQDGKNKQTADLNNLDMARAGERDDWPDTQSQILKETIGYLRIPYMGDAGGINDWMKKFKDTRGMIIDVRGTGGGKQDIIRTLLPWFMKPKSPLKVINISAYRLPLPVKPPNPSGFLGEGMHPVSSARWSAPQAAQISAFLKTWEPQWKLPPDKFTDWHVMAVSAESNGDAKYYDKPVIVLMDSRSSNAADNLLAAFKGHPNVTLIGTPGSGGGGRTTTFALPNTKTEVTFPHTASFYPSGKPSDAGGIQPDVTMEPTLDDQIDGRGDSVLQAAVARLEQ
ncbi:MAG TPA: S41 family peptidase [Verrucomicrobiales bacterium]|nr:S41 family peptidase [Verrucomicrobiales bacterium]